MACDDFKEAFITKEWNAFHLLGKKLEYIHLKAFYQIQMRILFEATIDTTTTQDHCCLLHFES